MRLGFGTGLNSEVDSWTEVDSGVNSSTEEQSTAQRHQIGIAVIRSTLGIGTSLETPRLDIATEMSSRLEASLKCLRKALMSSCAVLMTTGNTDVATMTAEDSNVVFMMAGDSGITSMTAAGSGMTGGASPHGCVLLAWLDMVLRIHTPHDSPSLANSSEKGPSFSDRGHPLAPAS